MIRSEERTSADLRSRSSGVSVGSEPAAAARATAASAQSRTASYDTLRASRDRRCPSRAEAPRNGAERRDLPPPRGRGERLRRQLRRPAPAREEARPDHALALELWASGNADARSLATLVADPAQLTRAQADQVGAGGRLLPPRRDARPARGADRLRARGRRRLGPLDEGLRSERPGYETLSSVLRRGAGDLGCRLPPLADAHRAGDRQLAQPLASRDERRRHRRGCLPAGACAGRGRDGGAHRRGRRRPRRDRLQDAAAGPYIERALARKTPATA